MFLVLINGMLTLFIQDTVESRDRVGKSDKVGFYVHECVTLLKTKALDMGTLCRLVRIPRTS
jgi:hypothetical protein